LIPCFEISPPDQCLRTAWQNIAVKQFMGKSSIQELRKNGSFEQLICIQEKLKLFSMRMSKSDLLIDSCDYATRSFLG